MPSIGTSHRAPGRARRDVFVRESVGETRFPFHRSAKVARAMDRSDAELFTLRVGDTHTVSGPLSAPPHPRACYVLAHGAGAGMSHPFMEAVATELAQRGIATLRYHFPFMEQGAKRPDLRSSRMRRFGPRWRKPAGFCPQLLLWRAANHS